VTAVDVSAEYGSLPDLVNQVSQEGKRIVLEQQGKAAAALITYQDLQRLETLEAMLLQKAEQEEYAWLRAAVRSSAFEALRDPAEDIYTLADGQPFRDPEWEKAAIGDADFPSPLHSEEDIYTLADGQPFNDEG